MFANLLRNCRWILIYLVMTFTVRSSSNILQILLQKEEEYALNQFIMNDILYSNIHTYPYPDPEKLIMFFNQKTQ